MHQAIKSVTVLLCLFAGSALGQRTTANQFNCVSGFTVPCNGEFVEVRGLCRFVYHFEESENGPHHVIQAVLHAKGTGVFGNDYVLNMVAGGQFSAPTVDFGNGLLRFDMPLHAVQNSEDAGIEMELTGIWRIFVRDGRVVGASHSFTSIICL